jgi:hypothetical protein
MILLIHPKYLHLFEGSGALLNKWLDAAGIVSGTPIYAHPDLPEVDEAGRPILAFRVSARELHYWCGEAIAMPAGIEQ